MWLLSAHGTTDHLEPEVAKELEQKLVDAVHGVVSELVPEGHQGVAASFSGDHVGEINLVAPGDAVTPTPDAEDGDKADGTFQPAPSGPPPAFTDESSPQDA